MLTIWGMLVVLAIAGDVDMLQGADIRDVKVQGEIGRRIDITINNNLMVMDLDKDFLEPFRKRTSKDGYIGLGKTIDAFVHMAAYSGDPRVLERKNYIVRETIATQKPDGCIGLMVPESRMWKLWDIHEMSYFVYGLTMDYHVFHEQASLDAARRLAVVEQKLADHDRQILSVVEAIRQLADPGPVPPRRRIGFNTAHEG